MGDEVEEMMAEPENVGLKAKPTRRRTKKHVPTISGTHIGGAESLSRKNQREHPDHYGIMLLSNIFSMHGLLMLPIRLVVYPLEMYLKKGQVQDRPMAKIQDGEAYSSIYDECSEKSQGHMKHPSDERLLTRHQRRGTKAVPLDARHLASDCAIERELFFVCMKQSHTQVDVHKCDKQQSSLRKCVRSMEKTCQSA